MNNTVWLGLVLIVAVLLGWYLYNQRTAYPNEGSMVQEAGEADVEAYENQPAPVGDGYMANSSPQEQGNPTDVEEPMSNPSACYPKDQLTPAELLPQDFSSTWAKCNPTGAGSLEGKNFLDAGWHVGINTVGQTLRNANLQLRSDPPNPQVKVSPWMQSTVEPDTNRRYLEIGNC